MSDDTGRDETGPDALTPFEFALAGVTPPGSRTGRSIQVIEEMRAFIDGIDEVPVTSEALQDFLDSGGLIARRNDRRRRRTRRTGQAPAATGTNGNGSFIDITPPDMVEAMTNGTGAGDDRADGSGGPDEPGLANESVEANEGAEASDQALLAVAEPDLPAALTGSEPVVIEAPPGALADDLATGPIAAELVGPLATGPIAAGDDEALGTDTTEEAAEADDATDEGTEVSPPSIDEAPKTAGSPLGTTTDRIRDRAGRFGPTLGPHRDAAVVPGGADTDGGSPAEPDIEAGVLLGRIDDTIFEETDEAAGRPVVSLGSAAATPGIFDETAGPAAIGGPPMATGPSSRLSAAAAGRRSGGALWALVGAGAAAAVLVAGSLWWATSGSSSSTETESATSEVAVVPSTAEGDPTGGSRNGTAERSTGGDDEPAAEFGGDRPATTDSTNTTGGTATTIGASSSTVAIRASTTVVGGETTTVPSDQSASTEVSVSPSSPRQTTTSTTRSPGTTRSRPPTTTPAPPTTRAATTTEQPTTTAALERPVFIGDKVSVGDYDGPGLGGVQVSLYVDDDRDGGADRLVATRSTSNDGRYSFDQPPGCYEVRFAAPSGYRIRPELSRQYLCLGSGEVAARTDAIADALTSAPPSGCLVERGGSGPGLGVEVYERSTNWAPSYTFYTRSGSVVARTRDLGPYDTDDGDPTDREWFGAENGFNHRSVWSVAAERNGIESARITCSRD